MVQDLRTAFLFLTRLPVAGFAPPGTPPGLAGAVWAFPMVGLAVGAIGGAVYWLLYRLGAAPLLAAPWALGATMLATGALHEDGLADTIDGFGGGDTAEGKRTIMRDSRIGTYGVLALVLSSILRIGAIAALGKPEMVLKALILAGMMGRSGMILLMVLTSPAREDGLAAAAGRPPRGSARAGGVIALLAALLLVPMRTAGLAVILGIGACLALGKLSSRQVGGYTGDVLGAAEVMVECVVLTLGAMNGIAG